MGLFALLMQVTPEIRRELSDSLNRGEKAEDMDILLLANLTFPIDHS